MAGCDAPPLAARLLCAGTQSDTSSSRELPSYCFLLAVIGSACRLRASLRAHGRSCAILMRRDDVGPNSPPAGRHDVQPALNGRSPRYPLRLARHAGRHKRPEMTRNVSVRRACALCLALLGVVPAAVQSQPANTTATFNGTTKARWSDQSAAADRVQQLEDALGLRGPVLRFTAYNTDVAPLTPTSNPRAQLVGPSTILPGAEVWESWRMLLPASFPDVPSSDWLVLVTPAYGPPYGGPPPLILEAEGSRLTLRASVYAVASPTPVWSAPSRRGQWTRYTLHFDFATPGWVELYVDGRPQWLRAARRPRVHRLALNLVNPSNDGGANSARLSIYYQLGSFSQVTAYFADFRIGATRAAVSATG